MNKEVKELLDLMKKYASDNNAQGYLTNSQVKLLLDYINQLETNRDELKKWLKKNKDRYIYQDGFGEDWYFEDLDVFEELCQELERGKE